MSTDQYGMNSNHAPQHSGVTQLDGNPGGMVPVQQKFQRRMGVFSVTPGAEIAHKLETIDLPVMPPDYSTAAKGRARVKLAHDRFVFGTNDAELPVGAPPTAKGPPCATFVRKGQTVIQGVLDGERDESLDEEVREKHLKVACLNPACAGQRWASLKQFRAKHMTDRDAKKAFQAHVYYGVAEIPERVDEASGETLPAELVLITVHQ